MTEPSAGASLRLLAASCGARAAAEIGTGMGVSGTYLLRGMRPGGVLTTVDQEPARQDAAREVFADAGFPPNRYRLIPGRALQVLPRLADRGYDLVFFDGDQAEWTEYLAEALRLLRPGGLVCFAGVVPDSPAEESGTQRRLARQRRIAVREVVRAVRDNEELVPAVLPTPGGLLCAVKPT